MASSRPSDHIDAPAESAVAENPRLGPLGFARFMWRQLTSMRTALVLLLLLALAAVPGSLVPQRSSDPNGVFQYRAQNPELFDVLELLRAVQHLLDPVVLGHLPAAVRLADRLHHPALEAPPRRVARSPAQDPRAAVAAGGVHREDDDGGCRDCGSRGPRGSEEPGLPRRTVRRLDLGRARLPARDGQPDLSHRSRRRSRGGRDRRRVRVHRAATARRGGAVHERARRLRLVQRRSFSRPRHRARTLPSATRRVHGQLRVRRSRRQLASARFPRPR